MWLMLNLTGVTWMRFAIWMVVGVVIYAGVRTPEFGAWAAGEGDARSLRQSACAESNLTITSVGAAAVRVCFTKHVLCLDNGRKAR